ncbi:toll/interleukin-1 receptor domain-containing protein [Rhodococcus pyridinivorans]|uniref:toll/interleukin-1 receptor domain-containing protein n=1 Tax=Rhodococcus pyridinivorans TaxID=103816 RepID=UPI00280AC428|nr:toll/interleukin-1 receptor domain-containing protein [Rhodococcus pyridinivorans]WMM74430.1 toll/interleukin-1 receptor domain-containing protein [Rhodococcus pyridinivorans]
MADDDFKIFISWSGEVSKNVALIWRDLLDELFDRVTPWVSDADIEAGSRGLDEIKRELDGTSFGIIVVTQANQNAPWINFEAGALSKALPNAATRVIPSLVDFTSPAQITSPLKQFQATLLDEEGVGKTLKAIASAVEVDWETKKRSFLRMWPEYNQRFSDTIVNSFSPHSVVPRSTEDMLQEVLTLLRDMQRTRESQGIFSYSGEYPRTISGLAVLDEIHTAFSRVGLDIYEARNIPSEDGKIVVEVLMNENIAHANINDLNEIADRFRRLGVTINYRLTKRTQ